MVKFALSLWLAWQASSLPGVGHSRQLWPAGEGQEGCRPVCLCEQLAQSGNVMDWQDSILADPLQQLTEEFRKQFMGGSVHEDEQNKSENTELQFTWETLPQHQPHLAYLQEIKPSRAFHRRRRCWRRCEYDPADRALQGECLFAALYYVCSGERATRASTHRVRMEILRYAQADNAVLQLFAEIEGCSVEQYQEIIKSGWGGLPEIYAFCCLHRTAIAVRDSRGYLITQIGEGLNPHVLGYNGMHYWVMARSDSRMMKAPRFCRPSSCRGGMPRLPNPQEQRRSDSLL